MLAAIQHILAMILGVMAPPAIVATALGIPEEAIVYLVSMSMLFAGIGISFQVSRPFGIGSGMLSVQATSFAFPGTLITIGLALMRDQGIPWQEALCTLYGVCFLGGILVMLGSRMIPFLRRIITPTVAGITVLMIGVSLVKVGALDLAGGAAAKADGTFADPLNLVLGTVVILLIINRREAIVVATSLGMGILSLTAPEVFARLPSFLQMFFHSGIVSGGVTAMIVNQILPRDICPYEAEELTEDCDSHPEFFFNKYD